MKVTKRKITFVRKRQLGAVIGSLTSYKEYYVDKKIRWLDKRNPTINPFAPCDPLCVSNTDLRSNSNISEAMRINIALFLKSI